MRKLLLTVVLLTVVLFTQAQVKPATDAKMNSFIATLMAKMTLDEKLGQLNLPAAGDITTGQANSSDVARKIKEKLVGFSTSSRSVRYAMCKKSPLSKVG